MSDMDDAIVSTEEPNALRTRLSAVSSACTGPSTPQVPLGRMSSRGSGKGARSVSGSSSSCGPCIAIALVGYSRGRWHHEFKSSPGKGATSMMHNLISEAQCHCSEPGVQWQGDFYDRKHAGIIGFAKLRAWSLEALPPPLKQVDAMVLCLQEKHRRCQSMAVIEHHILAASVLESELPLNDFNPLQAPVAADKSLISVPSYIIMRDGQQRSHFHRANGIDELLSIWGFHGTSTIVYIWPVWWPLAWLMARGHWLVDVTAIVPRLKIASWRPPVQPPRSTLRMIRNSRVSRTVVSDQPQETAVGSEYIDLTLSKKRNRATSFVHPAFQADHMIRTVITGRHLKNTGCVQESSVDHLSLMFPMHVEPLQIRLKEKGSMQRNE